MGKWSYTKSANRKSGGGLTSTQGSIGHDKVSPELERDAALVARARTHVLREMRAVRIAGKKHSASTTGTYHWIRSMQRDIWYRKSLLSKKQRASLMKVLSITELPPVRVDPQAESKPWDHPLKPPVPPAAPDDD